MRGWWWWCDVIARTWSLTWTICQDLGTLDVEEKLWTPVGRRSKTSTSVFILQIRRFRVWFLTSVLKVGLGSGLGARRCPAARIRRVWAGFRRAWRPGRSTTYPNQAGQKQKKNHKNNGDRQSMARPRNRRQHKNYMKIKREDRPRNRWPDLQLRQARRRERRGWLDGIWVKYCLFKIGGHTYSFCFLFPLSLSADNTTVQALIVAISRLCS